jgi:hypothetical protein
MGKGINRLVKLIPPLNGNLPYLDSFRTILRQTSDEIILATGEKSDYKGTVSVRYKGGSRGTGFYAYNISISNIENLIKKWLSQGAKKSLITFNESAPDNFLTIQGELMETPNGLNLFYSKEKKKMNLALKKGKTILSLQAKLILKQFLNCISYDEIMILLKLFPEHVIEFSTYDINLGILPNRNTIIWEIRKY